MAHLAPRRQCTDGEIPWEEPTVPVAKILIDFIKVLSENMGFLHLLVNHSALTQQNLINNNNVLYAYNFILFRHDLSTFFVNHITFYV